MNTHGRINPETLSAFLEGLPDLLESLRAHGYGLGTRQHVAAHELVGSLFAHGGLPPTLLELDEWLAPLICFTPAQQEDFRERYLQWLVERRLVGQEELPPPPPSVTVPPPPPVLPPPPLWERVARRLSAHRRLLLVSFSALVIAASLFAAYYFAAYYWSGEDPTQVVVLDPPVPDPTPVPVPHDDVKVVSLPQAPTPDVGLAWDADKPEGGKAETISLLPIFYPLPPAGFWVRNFSTLVALVLVTPFAALGLWRVLRRRQRRRDAERWREEHERDEHGRDKRPRYDKIKVRGVRVFQSAALRPIARGLRHYLSVESRQLDARATVRASAGRGGLFTPVYGRRRTLPEYLVLIDRVGFGDQLAQFNSDIVARLSEHDVYLDTYYFHGDPRRCREGGADSPQLSLSDLAARHPDHYLIIFSDGTGLLSTTTGRPEPFVEQLLYWRGRALLTPIPRLEWEYREWALEREGLKVLPASIDGLRLLVDAVSTGGRPTRTPGFDETPPYPDILRAQPALWKERDEPSPSQTRRLVTHLRRYLGPEGFELLCACAVYPLMQWSVTLFLAYELLGRHKVEEVLPRLLRLPWFRNGTMPQWLRRILVRELPRARRRLVRERLEHLLLAFLEAPEQGLRPRFAEEQGAQAEAAHVSLLTRLSERLAAWRRSRRLRRRLAQAPARSPLAEPVFLNYITNNQHAESLPAPVRNRLFRRGVAAFGLRLAPVAALVAVVALIGLFLLLLGRPVYNIYTAGFPSNLMESMLAPTPEPNQSTDPDFTYTPTTVKQGQTVDVTVRVVTPGEYDLSKMTYVTAGPGGKITLLAIDGGRGLSYSAISQNSDTLSIGIGAAPDAPLGPTELLLYDGNKLRARLPFNVTAAAPTPTQPCPKIVPMPFIAPNVITNQTSVAVSIAGAPSGAVYTYFWVTEGKVRIQSGQGTPVLSVLYPLDERSGPRAVKVTVGGFPAACRNVLTIDLTATRPSPNAAPALSVTPQEINICANNPEMSNPWNSQVVVTLSSQGANYRMSYSEGKAISDQLNSDGSRKIVWDLSASGVAWKAQVTADPINTLGVSPEPQPLTGEVLIKEDCAPQTRNIRISFNDDYDQRVDFYNVNMTVKLVRRGSPSESLFTKNFTRFPMQAQAFEFIIEKVPPGEYELVVTSPEFVAEKFPISVNEKAGDSFNLKLRRRRTAAR